MWYLYSLFFLFLSLEAFAQVISLDTLALENAKNDINYEYLCYLIKDQKIRGKTDKNYNPSTENYKTAFLWNEAVAQVYFLEEIEDSCFLMLYRVDETQHFAVYTDDLGSHQRVELGEDILGFYKKQWGKYEVFVIRHIVLAENGENAERYTTFVRNKKDYFFSEKTISTWLTRQGLGNDKSAEIIFYSEIQFQEVDFELYIVQTFQFPENKISPLKLVDGKFVRIY